MGEIAQSGMQTRVDRERTWHDTRFAKNPSRRWSLSSMMGDITRDALYLTYNTTKPYCDGAVVLDYGCAQGEASLILRGYRAAHVDGIDISPVAIAQASATAKAKGVDHVRFQVMDAHSLSFEDRRFDLVYGIGILHHVDLARASLEISRVLKKNGVAIFLEPLGHNPAINLVRRLTPHLRTDDERPLRVSDLQMFRSYFGLVQTRFVNLSTLLAVPLARVPGAVLLRRALTLADRGLFATIPFCRRFAWNVVITLGQPIDRDRIQ